MKNDNNEGGIKILLVEDDPFLIDIYSTKLRQNGFSLETANDGEEALKKIAEIKPAIVLLDIVLPRIDGWEIITKVKADPNLKDIKIIILSNLGQAQEVKKGLELGASGYLIKSHYAPNEIVEEIKKILYNK